MDAVIDILGLVTVTGSATVAGGQIFCLLAVLPALPSFSQDMSARVHQEALTDRPHRYLRAASIVTIVSTAALLVLLFGEDDSWAARILFCGGLAAMLVSGVASSREWPINDEINAWGDSPVLDRYAVLREKWDSQHRFRTLLSVISLLCFITGLLVSEQL